MQNGQVERFNRTFKEAATKRYFDANKTEFEQHLAWFLQVYNFGKRLRILKYLTPIEKILDSYQNKEGEFKDDFNLGSLLRSNMYRVKTTKGIKGFGINTIKSVINSENLPTFINFFDSRDVLAKKINKQLVKNNLLLWERENIY